MKYADLKKCLAAAEREIEEAVEYTPPLMAPICKCMEIGERLAPHEHPR